MQNRNQFRQMIDQISLFYFDRIAADEVTLVSRFSDTDTKLAKPSHEADQFTLKKANHPKPSHRA